MPSTSSISAAWARVLPGAILGSASGISALLLYTNGLFVAGLSREFGLTRTQFGLGVSLVTLALAAANPLVGWAVDRWGARRPAMAGLVLLALGFASLGAFVHSIGSYLLLQSSVAFAGAASGPIAYTKIISATFQKHRGLALGLTMTGIGCSAAAVPPVLSSIIAAHGWRVGFFALSVVPLVGALATALLIPRKTAGALADGGRRGSGPNAPDTACTSGTSDTVNGRPIEVPMPAAGHWIRSRVFWVMAAAFAMMSLSFAGLLPHFVPMLTDAGLTPIAAGRVAGEIGLAVIASRLVVGFLLDRMFAPRIAIAISLITASGCVVFIVNGVTAASLSAIALGFAIGAELDLMGFLVARYFGLPEFGRIYGWLYCAFIFASGLGPLWVGALRDTTGNYTLSLALSAGGLVLACVGFLMLPRYEATSISSDPQALTPDPEHSDFAKRPTP